MTGQGWGEGEEADVMILKRSFGCSGGLWGDGKWLRAVGGGAYF